jgi:drug/metabolite transporter (DMT)-like permease
MAGVTTAPASTARRLAAAAYQSPALLLCLAVLGWSGNFVVGRLVHDSVPPVGLALARWTLASVLLAPWAWPRLRADLPALRRNAPVVLGLAATGVAVFNTLVYRGLQTTTVLNGLLLQSACPVLIVVFGYAFFRERPRRAQVAGLAVSLVGVWVVVSRGRPDQLTVSASLGDLWIFLAVVSYAAYTALLRRKPAAHPLSLLLATFVAGAAMLIPFAVAEALAGARMPLTFGAAAAVGYVGLVPSVVSYFCFNRGVELAGGARAGQFIHLMPVFGAVLAFVFLGESLQGFHLVGAAVIAAGLALAAR